MLTQLGYVEVAEPGRYLARLCYHFSRKIPVQQGPQQGVAHFPWGACVLTALPGGIRLECAAADGECLARLRHVLDSHVALFARRQAWRIQWSAPCATPEPRRAQTGEAQEASPI